MNIKNYNQIAGQRIRRVESLSDNVFAVAATLLVLNIKVPVSEAIRSEKDLATAFGALSPTLLTYFLSFITVGIFWTGQSVAFHYINKSDRNLYWINLFFLLLISLIPFTTAFLSAHIEFRFAIAVYWLNLLLLGIMILINWNYVDKHNFLCVSGAEKTKVVKAIKRRVLIAQTLYASGALLSLISPYLSIVVFCIVQLNYALAPFSKIRQASDEISERTSS